MVGMNELPYPSDLTAAQWAVIEPLLPAPKGRKRSVDLRKITNAIFCVLWTTYSAVGIQNSGRNHKHRSQSARRLDPRLFGALK